MTMSLMNRKLTLAPNAWSYLPLSNRHTFSLFPKVLSNRSIDRQLQVTVGYAYLFILRYLCCTLNTRTTQLRSCTYCTACDVISCLPSVLCYSSCISYANHSLGCWASWLLLWLPLASWLLYLWFSDSSQRSGWKWLSVWWLHAVDRAGFISVGFKTNCQVVVMLNNACFHRLSVFFGLQFCADLYELSGIFTKTWQLALIET